MILAIHEISTGAAKITGTTNDQIPIPAAANTAVNTLATMFWILSVTAMTLKRFSL